MLQMEQESHLAGIMKIKPQHSAPEGALIPRQQNSGSKLKAQRTGKMIFREKKERKNERKKEGKKERERKK